MEKSQDLEALMEKYIEDGASRLCQLMDFSEKHKEVLSNAFSEANPALGCGFQTVLSSFPALDVVTLGNPKLAESLKGFVFSAFCLGYQAGWDNSHTANILQSIKE
jgi:hypothetical protein